ncbi:MAG: zinc metalloprotease HtpX [Candidatus Marinimicrobia bacterium]|nr:zinc metalloprotease HtpX [Candidatus Neomarinimicrobiota bacterium]MCF7828957.1 zinc metalloprotease HtpX [Candidatus Neomarinimicrobiota bacterium]MCF7879917.1 zinc metalloprotease HtpX [Candidatus Neomarinimicrobiota bacterium]
MNYFKTTILLAALTGLLIVIGNTLGGTNGAVFAFIIAIGMNFFSYWFSDKMVLKMYKAKPVDESQAPELYRVVRRLTQQMGMPMPSVHIIPMEAPNAFATGRNPEHAAVAVTEGILDILDKDELEGVLAHELAHVEHRDILISSIAATIAGAITLIASIARFAAIFGFGGRDGDNNLIGTLAMAFLAPIAAGLIQMAVSRSREYHADEGGARISKQPLALASALEKLEQYSKRTPMKAARENTAHLFIVNPLTKKGFANLFRTHPPTDERVKRLREMA